MARIRTIKPEFFTSEDIVSLTPLSRLFYVSLWCESDREGRLEWKPGTFKMRYFPGDSCDIHAMGDELVANKLIVIYAVDGKTYAEIPTFKEHQIINNRETLSSIPPRVNHASTTRQPRVKAEGKEGREGREGNSTDLLPKSEPVVSIPLNDNTEHPITQSLIDEWAQTFPAVDVVQELREMRTWSSANPSQRKTARGVNAFVVRWLGKEQDKGGKKFSGSPVGMFAGAI